MIHILYRVKVIVLRLRLDRPISAPVAIAVGKIRDLDAVSTRPDVASADVAIILLLLPAKSSKKMSAQKLTHSPS